MKDLTIFIPTYERLPFLKKCIKNIYDSIWKHSFEIFIVDSGSNDGTMEYLLKLKKKYNNFHVFFEETPTGNTHALNTAIPYISSKFFLNINDDCKIISKIIDEVIIKMDSLSKNIAICGLRECFDTIDNTVTRTGVNYKNGMYITNFAVIRSYVIKALYPLDEDFPFYCLFPDMFYRAFSLGLDMIMNTDVSVIQCNLKTMKENIVHFNVHKKYEKNMSMEYLKLYKKHKKMLELYPPSGKPKKCMGL